ncbi:MAG: hypothetical protein M3Q08_00605 [Pseudomonadota bacterium]|nr:hypothetical protein [Pseudomonadota bacterium]
MRILVLATGAALALTACGGGGEQADANTADAMATDANMMAADNMMMDENGMMNGAAMNGNMAADPTTQNMMMQDMNTNAPDTNLANGM